MRISDWSSDVCSSDREHAGDERKLLLLDRIADLHVVGQLHARRAHAIEFVMGAFPLRHDRSPLPGGITVPIEFRVQAGRRAPENRRTATTWPMSFGIAPRAADHPGPGVGQPAPAADTGQGAFGGHYPGPSRVDQVV